MPRGSEICPPLVLKVGKEGRVTLPKSVRELLNIDQNDIVIIEIVQVERRRGGEEE